MAFDVEFYVNLIAVLTTLGTLGGAVVALNYRNLKNALSALTPMLQADVELSAEVEKAIADDNVTAEDLQKIYVAFKNAQTKTHAFFDSIRLNFKI